MNYGQTILTAHFRVKLRKYKQLLELKIPFPSNLGDSNWKIRRFDQNVTGSSKSKSHDRRDPLIRWSDVGSLKSRVASKDGFHSRSGLRRSAFTKMVDSKVLLVLTLMVLCWGSTLEAVRLSPKHRAAGEILSHNYPVWTRKHKR